MNYVNTVEIVTIKLPSWRSVDREWKERINRECRRTPRSQSKNRTRNLERCIGRSNIFPSIDSTTAATSFQRNSVDRTSSLARVFLTPRSVPLTGKLPLRVELFRSSAPRSGAEISPGELEFPVYNE